MDIKTASFAEAAADVLARAKAGEVAAHPARLSQLGDVLLKQAALNDILTSLSGSASSAWDSVKNSPTAMGALYGAGGGALLGGASSFLSPDSSFLGSTLAGGLAGGALGAGYGALSNHLPGGGGLATPATQAAAAKEKTRDEIIQKGRAAIEANRAGDMLDPTRLVTDNPLPATTLAAGGTAAYLGGRSVVNPAMNPRMSTNPSFLASEVLDNPHAGIAGLTPDEHVYEKLRNGQLKRTSVIHPGSVTNIVKDVNQPAPTFLERWRSIRNGTPLPRQQMPDTLTVPGYARTPASYEPVYDDNGLLVRRVMTEPEIPAINAGQVRDNIAAGVRKRLDMLDSNSAGGTDKNKIFGKKHLLARNVFTGRENIRPATTFGSGLRRVGGAAAVGLGVDYALAKVKSWLASRNDAKALEDLTRLQGEPGQ